MDRQIKLKLFVNFQFNNGAEDVDNLNKIKTFESLLGICVVGKINHINLLLNYFDTRFF